MLQVMGLSLGQYNFCTDLKLVFDMNTGYAT